MMIFFFLPSIKGRRRRYLSRLYSHSGLVKWHLFIFFSGIFNDPKEMYCKQNNVPTSNDAQLPFSMAIPAQ